MKFKLTLLPLAVFALLFVFLLKGLFSDPSERDSALIGKPIPDFALPDLDDPSITHTPATLAQGPILLNVWGTWCTTCQYELPFLSQLSTEYGVTVVGLYYDISHAPEFGQFANPGAIKQEVHDMVARLGNPYAYNILDLDRNLALNLGVTGAPESFLIDSSGVIRAHHMGDVNERVWRDVLAPVWSQMK